MALVLLALGFSPLTYPEPAVQTAVQQAVVATTNERAAAASAAATPKLLALLDTPAVRLSLRQCCSAVASLTSAELLDRIRAELRAAELAHNFPTIDKDMNAGSDMTLDQLDEFSWWLNPYEVDLVDTTAPTPASEEDVRCDYFGCHRRGRTTLGASLDFENWAEEAIFGCPPFAGATPTWAEASNRLIYVALNARRADTGSLPNFGTVSVVFKHAAVAPMVEIAAIDTGLWEMSCNQSSQSKHHLKLNIDCNFSDITQAGTLEHLDHVLLGNLGMWATSGPGPLPPSTLEQEAAFFLGRSALADAEYTDLAPTNDSMNLYKYPESNLLGNPRLSAIKFFVPLFGAVFGSDAGEKLLALAAKRRTPVVWALGDGTDGEDMHHHPPHHFGPPPPPPPPPSGFNQRLLDPSASAASGLNATLPATANATFARLWAAAKQARAGGKQPTVDVVKGWWEQLRAATLQLAPLSATSCASASLDECVGTVVGSGDCVCGGGASPLVEQA